MGASRTTFGTVEHRAVHDDSDHQIDRDLLCWNRVDNRSNSLAGDNMPRCLPSVPARYLGHVTDSLALFGFLFRAEASGLDSIVQPDRPT